MSWRHIVYKLTACPLWRISEVFQWLWGFFEQCGNWWEDLLWTQGGPQYGGFKWLFQGKHYRYFDEYEGPWTPVEERR